MTSPHQDYEYIKSKYQKVFGTADGKEVLKDMEERCFFMAMMYQGDVNGLLIKEGRRSVYLEILSLVNDPLPDEPTTDNSEDKSK